MRHYRDGALIESGAFDPAREKVLRSEPGTCTWIDADDPSAEEVGEISECFDLHPLAVEDSQHRGQRPKMESYENHGFIVLQALDLGDEGDLVSSEIHAFTGEGYLITLRFAPVFDLATVQRRFEGRPEFARQGAPALIYLLLDEIVDGYFQILDRLEDLAEDVEDRVFVEEPSTALQQSIYRLKRHVVELRRSVMPMREVVDQIQEQPGYVPADLAPYYRDVADHILRTLEFIDALRDLLTTSLEAELSQVSNALNQTMKRVTSYGAILLVPTLIAGIYGMNFRQMPELHWAFGYPASLLLIVGSMVGLYLWFKKKGYL